MAIKVKEKNVEIDFDEFMSEFYSENNFHYKTINVLKENYLKTLKRLVKKYKLNLLTDENLIQSRDDMYEDYSLRDIDISELSLTERTIWDFYNFYESEGKDFIYEVYPNINLKQSQ